MKSAKSWAFIRENAQRIFRPLKDEEVLFRLTTTLKISLIPFLTLAILGVFLHTVLQLNLMYFKANGFGRVLDLQDAYYDYILSTFLDMLPFIAGIFVAIVFMGLYLSHMLLRPFRNIGNYCEKVLNNQEAIYNPDFITDLTLLTGFSEYFFNIMENALKSKHLDPMAIPMKFGRIHKPVFEKSFFLQYSVFLLITSIALATAIYAVTTDIYGHMVKLSITTLKQNQSMAFFLKEQEKIISDVALGVMTSHVILYAALAFHLYQKVSIPAFGVFATMRSFMKGNYNSRIHLIGHNYLRHQGRLLNKYLDMLERETQGQTREKVHPLPARRS